MKLIALATMAVAFLATTVHPKFNLGSCPGADTPRIAYGDQLISTPFAHYLSYVDRGMIDFISGL